ncbi:MAG: hypothetical protein II716_05990, partial [Treponema sp.]|nr:hypothetical protein [Treponema sp.]
MKVLKYASDILIRPKCMEIPCITSYSPASKSQQFANTPVVINFNVPMEDREIAAEESLFNYDNISLMCSDRDMSSYFDKPEFDDGKTVLTIRPVGAELKKFITNNNLSYVDINFSFSDAIIAKTREYSFPLRQNSNSSFTVRYNSDLEETPPECKDFFVTKQEIVLDSVPDFDRTQILNTYGEYLKQDDYISSLMSPTFYIYGKFYDKDSLVRTIEVNEECKRLLPQDDSTSSTITSTVYEAKSDNIEFK